MIILLPPSESKTAPATGRPLDLMTLSYPELNPARRTVMGALEAVSISPDACRILGVSQQLMTEVAHNAVLESSPAGRAVSTYTGVLYSALDPLQLDRRASRRLGRVYVSSALFGIVGAGDRIPAYRLSMKTRLPALGGLAAFWRRELTAVLDQAFAGELILDCRSTEYRKSWPGPPSSVVTVDVVTERDGRRSVVSHNAKHTRGLIAGHLLRRAGSWPRTAAQLISAVAESFEVEFTEATQKAAASLTVVLRG